MLWLIWGVPPLLGFGLLIGGWTFQHGNPLLDSVQIVREYDEEGQEKESVHEDSEDAKKSENHRYGIAAPWALSAHRPQLLTAL